MTGGLIQIVLAGLVLLVTHFGISSSPLRAGLVGKIGEGPYKGLYSLVSLGAFAWLWLAFRGAEAPPLLWYLGSAGLMLPLILMPVALLMIVSAEMPRPAYQATGMRRITRHPMLWGIALWAILHLLANGLANEVLFFVVLLVLAIAGTHFIDGKAQARDPEAFADYRAQTSNVPFAAILAGRQAFGPVFREMGWKTYLITLIAYVAIIGIHPFLFGVYPHPI